MWVVLAVVAVVVLSRRGSRNERSDTGAVDPASGGRSAQETAGTLVHAENPPQEMHEDEALAMGVARFEALLQGHPPSPLCNFKATNHALWTINPDGSLYTKVEWSDCVVAGPNGDASWTITGKFMHDMFRWLHLQPMSQWAEPLAELLAKKVRVREPSEDPPAERSEQ